MNSSNLGIVKVSARMVSNQPSMIAEAFGLLKFVPVRCELMFDTNELEYTAICERFPEVPTGDKPPQYDLRITQNKRGNVELVEVVPLVS